MPKRKAGSLVKIELWVDDAGNMTKYSMAYINHTLFAGDNGRVLGYDNSHAYHHKHDRSDIYPVDDFESFEQLLERFQHELQEFIS